MFGISECKLVLVKIVCLRNEPFYWEEKLRLELLTLTSQRVNEPELSVQGAAGNLLRFLQAASFSSWFSD